MSQHRIVVLKDMHSERYLPIWIGPFEADAITVELQEMPSARPLTHDLLKSVIRELGGKVIHVLINDLRNEVYYARLVINVNGKQMEVDSRPSDAIALAVRVKAPIYVAEGVMEKAAFEPDEDIENEAVIGEEAAAEAVDEGKLSAFADFVNTLDLDDLDTQDSDD
jgi:bifunctional DNase/RNase